MKPKHKRLLMISGVLGCFGLAAFLVMSALEDNIVFFFSPSEIYTKVKDPQKLVRLGGLVEKGSLKREGTKVHFIVSDGSAKLPVIYEGILPDLFREGQGVVSLGYLKKDHFEAQDVLAKHDENYMPPEVVDALKKTGRWQDAE
ncbi:Cytochrome c-type biogenesis protein CcmE [Candidatus Bealeia paramacronuclearis]|uniref:Cytochrome c-type biogenesis protein CcmE n=1 Tax=Candidatus Bealeia paramacronuclearis TaxID=1921001 RepID=A0ABZ2C1C2_9PROT|nr:Cytochrome c-type biogenesis protein CcmE [Candidatus Bealeia paramacronuclearis]